MINISLKSIKIKLALILITATALILAGLSWFNYNQASSILSSEIESAAINSAKQNAKIITNWLQGIENEVVTLANTPVIQSMDWEKQLPVLEKVIQRHHDYEMFVVGDSTGQAFTTTGGDKIFDISHRDYFQEVMQTHQVAISKPIESQASQMLVIAIAAPIFNNESSSPVGVVLATVTLEYLQQLMNEINIDGHGYGGTMHNDMTIIAHPDQQFVNNKSIWDLDQRLHALGTKAAAGEEGMGEYTLQGVDKLMAYSPVAAADWSILITADTADVMAPLSQIKNTSVLFALVAILLMLLVAIAIAQYIAKPIINLSQVAEAVAGGDLTQKIDTRQSNDEIGNLTTSFTKMVDNLKTVLFNMQNTSDRLASHSQELASSSEEVSATVEEMASTTNEVAATAEQGAENAEMAAQESDQAQQVAKDGNQAMQEAVAKMQSISQSSKVATEAVRNLGQQSNQIGAIINTITGIADQTNLLALNAAIEAARAGEHGRGFAVVAEEVRQLAEQSVAAANEITDLIKEMQNGVGKTVTAIEHSLTEVEDGVKVANNANSALKEIIKAINNNTTFIKNLAEGSYQSNEGLQQLSTANEQVASTVQQVSSAAQELANIAVELQNEVVQFKLDHEETGS